MKFLVSLIFVLNVSCAEDKSHSNIQHVSEGTPLNLVHDLGQLMQAIDRKDYVWVLVKCIDVYNDGHLTQEPIPVKVMLQLTRVALVKVHPVYLNVFPEKKPKNMTLTDALVDKVMNNTYMIEAASVYKKYEEPVFQGLYKLMF